MQCGPPCGGLHLRLRGRRKTSNCKGRLHAMGDFSGTKTVLSNHSTADMHHAAGGVQEAGFADVMTSLLAFDDAPNPRTHVFVRSAAMHQPDEIVIALREKAGADF